MERKLNMTFTEKLANLELPDPPRWLINYGRVCIILLIFSLLIVISKFNLIYLFAWLLTAGVLFGLWYLFHYPITKVEDTILKAREKCSMEGRTNTYLEDYHLGGSTLYIYNPHLDDYLTQTGKTDFWTFSTACGVYESVRFTGSSFEYKPSTKEEYESALQENRKTFSVYR